MKGKPQLLWLSLLPSVPALIVTKRYRAQTKTSSSYRSSKRESAKERKRHGENKASIYTHAHTHTQKEREREWRQAR